MDLSSILHSIQRDFKTAGFVKYGGQIENKRPETDLIAAKAEALLYRHNGGLGMSLDEAVKVFECSPGYLIRVTRNRRAKVNISGNVVIIHYNPEGRRSDPRTVKIWYDKYQKKYAPWAYSGPDLVLNPMHLRKGKCWVWDEEREEFVLSDL